MGFTDTQIKVLSAKLSGKHVRSRVKDGFYKKHLDDLKASRVDHVQAEDVGGTSEVKHAQGDEEVIGPALIKSDEQHQKP
jgi:hypothetical protein